MHNLLPLLLAFFAGPLPEVEPVDDLVITESCRLKPGDYRIPDGGEPGVIRIEGENIVVVMDGVTIDGAPAKETPPDERKGTGIVIRGRGNLLNGGTVRGFKVGLFVDGGSDHWLIGTESTENFAQRLKSTREAEDASDWLWPHQNDEGQWAENYGAAVRVRNAENVRLVRLRGRRQQNGILLENTTGSLVGQCDFSFQSGWGLAMWRSSDNRIEKNYFDWCVRGYSHGVYDRGQDSAGILVFEQCSRNVFRQNSATHSGDGFFLYAGHETTKETGEGGSNDNLVVENDFSYAVANGIEATFSSGNRFVKNRLDGCNYGIWAGYSRKSEFTGNRIRGSIHAGIAIEHGSENRIHGNLIEDSNIGIRLWWDEDPDFVNSVYGEKQRTDSADLEVSGNVIRGGKIGVLVETSADVRLAGNFIEGAPEAVAVRGECPELVNEPAETAPELELRPDDDSPRSEFGRDYVFMLEWGPYDFSSPRLEPVPGGDGAADVYLVLGLSHPAQLGEQKAADVSIEILRRMDAGPLVQVTPAPEKSGVLPYSFTVKTGDRELTASGALVVAKWAVEHRKFETDPRESAEAFAELLATAPAKKEELSRIDFAWGAGGPEGVGGDGFVTTAETSLALPAGRYEITTVSDDGVRVLVDGKPVIENWTHHTATEDRAVIESEGGEHRIRIEHFELTGLARLTFRIRPLPPDTPR